MRLIDADALEKRFEHLATVGNDLVHKVTEEEKGMRTAYRLAKYETHVAPAIAPESLQPQWIPVAERMPQEHQIVVGWTKDNPFSCYRAEVVTWNGKGWVFVYAQRYVTNVKYWMPLPEPYTAKVEDDDNARRVKPLEFDRFKNDTLKDAQPTTPAHWEKADIPLPYQMRTVPTPSGTFAHREMYVCSACDGYNDKNTQYCPHCGARMGEEDPE